ncbi:MAG: flippase [Acidobacteria bacterium]|nr:flippase [Acidobacteriota bacterium]
MNFRDRVSMTLLARGLTLAIGLLSSVVTARWLGPEGRGVLAILSVVTGLALQFGNLGLHSSGVYFMAREPRRAGAVLGTMLWLGLAIGIVTAVATVAACRSNPEWIAGVPLPLVLITAAALPFQFMILFFQNALLGMQDVRAFNVFEVANRTLTLGLLAVYLLVLSGGVEGVVVLFAAMGAAFGASSVLYCARRARLDLAPDMALLLRLLGFGGRSYLACLLSFLVIRSDMLLVNYFLGGAAAGSYSIAVQIADTLLLVPVTIGMILFPRIASEAPDEREATTARVARHAVFLMTVLCAAAFFLADPLIPFLYGQRFAAAVPATRWLLPGVWALGINGILMNHFAGRGMPWVVVWAPLAGVLVNLALNLKLIPALGLIGAAIASTIAYGIMLVIGVAAFLRRSRAGLRETLVVGPEEVAGLLGLRP